MLFVNLSEQMKTVLDFFLELLVEIKDVRTSEGRCVNNEVRVDAS